MVSSLTLLFHLWFANCYEYFDFSFFLRLNLFLPLSCQLPKPHFILYFCNQAGTTPAFTLISFKFKLWVYINSRKKKNHPNIPLSDHFLPSQEHTITHYYKSYQVPSTQLHCLIPPHTPSNLPPTTLYHSLMLKSFSLSQQAVFHLSSPLTLNFGFAPITFFPTKRNRDLETSEGAFPKTIVQLTSLKDL